MTAASVFLFFVIVLDHLLKPDSSNAFRQSLPDSELGSRHAPLSGSLHVDSDQVLLQNSVG